MDVIRIRDNTKFYLRSLKEEFNLRTDSEAVAYLLASHAHFRKNITLDTQKQLEKNMKDIDSQAIII